MSRAPSRSHGLASIFAIPLAIAVFSLIGLVAALAGNGPADLLSWAGLAVPLLAICWAWIRRRR